MSLKTQAFSGIFWVFIDTFLIKGLPFCATFILARLLGPDEFGLVGLVSIFIALGLTLVDSGLSLSLIRTVDADTVDNSTIFYTNLGISILLYILMYLASPSIAAYFDQPILTNIIRLYCLSFILSAASAVQIALIQKALQFKKLMLCNVPGAIIGVVVALTLGYRGYGIWSLIWMYLTTQLVQTGILWYVSEWKPQRVFSAKKLATHINFGYKLMLSGLLDNGFKNVYNLIIGKFYSVQILGFYERANTMNDYPVTLITGIINKVSYPILSGIQSDTVKVSEIYKKSLQVTFFFTAPLMLGLAAVIAPVITVILGDKWLPAIPYFQILSLGVIFYPIHAFNINVLKVYGKSSLFLKLEMIKKAVIVILILVSFPFGIYGLLWSTVVASVIALFINSYYSSEMIQYPVKEQFLDMCPILLLSLFMGASMFCIRNLLADLNVVIQILLPAIAGIVIYGLTNYFFRIPAFIYILRLIKTKNPI